jgi:hypothetical protein
VTRRDPSTDRVRRCARLVADALTGRRGVFVMMLGYASFAVVLLAYVSTQVYTSSLMEDISAKKRVERDLREKIGIQTLQYTTLASKARVASVCEGRLGMVQGDANSLRRVAVEEGADTPWPDVEFTERRMRIPEVLGSTPNHFAEVAQ